MQPPVLILVNMAANTTYKGGIERLIHSYINVLITVYSFNYSPQSIARLYCAF